VIADCFIYFALNFPAPITSKCDSDTTRSGAVKNDACKTAQLALAIDELPPDCPRTPIAGIGSLRCGAADWAATVKRIASAGDVAIRNRSDMAEN